MAFMALECDWDDRHLTLVNVYVPCERSTREAFYQRLREQPRPAGDILIGGDFNATLSSRDRPSTLLDAMLWLTTCGILDFLTDQQDDVEAIPDPEYAELYHTYRYSTHQGQVDTSRLDRWYGSHTLLSIRAQYTTCLPPEPSDHQAVRLALGRPGTHDRGRVEPRHVYPTRPRFQTVLEYLLQERDTFQQLHSPISIMARWEQLKLGVQQLCRVVPRRLRRRDRARYHGLRRRCVRRLQKLGIDSNLHSARRATLRGRLLLLQQAWAQARSQRRFHIYRGRHSQQLKAFFRRFRPPLASFEDTALAKSALQPGQSVVDVVQADWVPIMAPATTSTDRVAIEEMLTLRPRHRRTTAEQRAIATPITSAEVKTAGPDGLANDLYRTRSSTLEPILTKAYNACWSAYVVPRTFQDTVITAVPKVPSPQSGLDFRPIVKLNSDYKIYARVLATRLISSSQCGFVPGRSIHDAIDLMDISLKQIPLTNRHDATALLLDIAKAYDTVDRVFHHRTLAWLGFPLPFLRTRDLQRALRLVERFSRASGLRVQPSKTALTVSGTFSFDGAARGNPGPSGAGAALVQATPSEASIMWAVAKDLSTATNNQAVLAGLAAFRAYALTHVTIHGDSEFIINAMRIGRRPRKPNLHERFTLAHNIRSGFSQCRWQHQRRMFNRTADDLANLAVDQRRTLTFSVTNFLEDLHLKVLQQDEFTRYLGIQVGISPTVTCN
ncbi:TPA: LOW QUALITY PROTEIN: hypothetical protein N0F65_012780 [Lagenidium giganteum]|uniref:RNase H type-1 domain-containing protein n=1 Tax=Lagenidium giganteum TaxID=4803 RepID=A0AAV2YE45_9STRA|nr:TPA: LOW QUALITY PROTEIN: hypothetical protein N0F65_012780 [Lagenidium giganteum]